MARILISGASGFIGKPLLSFLRSRGHDLFSLSRKEGEGRIVWNPEKGLLNAEELQGFDAVIHLAGEPLTFSRWSSNTKHKILFSRSSGTKFLVDRLLQSGSLPRLFLSASAVGFYGDRGEEFLSEKSSCGTGFLSNVCVQWEEASSLLRQKGSRTVQARFGLVLGEGGALQKMLPLYRLGLGAVLGTGEQWVSWIHLKDLIRALSFIIETPSLQGAVNIVSPEPVRQREFSKRLAKMLHRSHFLKIPAWLLKALLGEVAKDLLLSSTKVQCAKLLEEKFEFLYPTLSGALSQALDRH